MKRGAVIYREGEVGPRDGLRGRSGATLKDIQPGV